MYKFLTLVISIAILYLCYNTNVQVKSLRTDVLKLQGEVQKLKVRAGVGRTAPAPSGISLDSLTKQGISKLKDAEKTINGLRDQLNRLTGQQ
ncbi:MAG: hypothetical protein ACYC1M_03635 [Armatimonadota bacterium]